MWSVLHLGTDHFFLKKMRHRSKKRARINQFIIAHKERAKTTKVKMDLQISVAMNEVL